MNEIMEKTYELIDLLDESSLIKDLVIYRDKILANDSLQRLIHEGNSSDDDYLRLSIKRKLYQDKDYQEYMNCYQELMYLVMDINSKYQKIIGKGSCHL